MKKKMVTLCLVVALVLTAVIGGTMAYFTAADSEKNEFTVGNVEIDLTEPGWTAEGGGAAQAEDVYPGEALAKDPIVTNKGENPCFVRVEVIGWDSLINAGLSASNIAYRTNYDLGKTGANWELHTDGYFYYKGVLEAGATTATPVFDSIVIPSDVINGAVGENEPKFALDVKAYAVQAQGARPSFTDVKNMTVSEIADWFKVCNPSNVW